MRFVILGNPENRRVALFQAALEGLGLGRASVVSYIDLLNGQVKLEQFVSPDSLIRIESTGEDWEVERAILKIGATQIDDDSCSERLSGTLRWMHSALTKGGFGRSGSGI
jgi:hypothetical protein